MGKTAKVIDVKESDLELKKHVGAIHINNKISFLQRKISNALLHKAYTNLLEKETHSIRIRELADLVGFDSKNEAFLKTALRALVSTTLEWNILDKKGGADWGITTILSQAVIRNGTCTYAYSPELRQKLYNPEFYAKMNLRIQSNFSSGHALALYENCLRFKAIGRTGFIDLSTFKKLMGVNDNKAYEQFKVLNRDVIKPAIKEVNAVSDIHLEIEQQTEGRRVVAIRFIILPNKQNALDLGSTVPDFNQNLLTKLIYFGLSDTQAKEILVKYSAEYISGNYDVVKKDVLANKVKNVPAYFLRALERDFRPREIKISPTEKSAKCVKGVEGGIDATLKNDFDSFRNQRLNTLLEQLNQEETSKLEEEYAKFLTENKSYLLKFYDKSGLRSKLVEKSYRLFLMKKLFNKEIEIDINVFKAHYSS